MTPRAPLSDLSSSGLFAAASTAVAASSARPMPSSASLLSLCVKIVVTSAKSTLMTPVFRISSAMQRMACSSTESAILNTWTSVILRFSGIFMRLSLWMASSASM